MRALPITWFVLPGNYGQPMANGFPETFWGTMTMALELGLEEYSQGVMENWLKYYVRNNGTTMYNHIGMTAHGRELTVFAQFYRYTGDSKGLLLKYIDRLDISLYIAVPR